MQPDLQRRESSAERFIGVFDLALKAITGESRALRVSPAENVSEFEMLPSQRRASVEMMRVNHAGEICAQALYLGQAAVESDSGVVEWLKSAAREEGDHLAWCESRIRELRGRTSALNPVWFGLSFAVGLAASAAGSRWNLGFLAETERQVAAHLEGHLRNLPPQDMRSRAIVRQMWEDEAWHSRSAVRLGGESLPVVLRCAMTVSAKIMTSIASRV